MTPIQPTTDELLRVIALLIVESDAQRIAAGKHTLSEGRRTFERERLDEAKHLNPTATISHSGTVVVSING